MRPGKAAGDGKLRDQFASELADHLDGVSADEVSKALEQVAAQHEQERRTAMAKALSAQLDGVSEQDVSAALEKAEQKMRDAFESGKPPEPGTFAKTLADELGVSRGRGHRRDARRREAGLRRRRPRAWRPSRPAADGLWRHAADAGGGPAPGGFAPPQSSGSGSSASGSGN